MGVDGVKIFGLDRDIMRPCIEEAHSARPAGRPPRRPSRRPTPGTTPRSACTSIEHWYGVPDAALDGSQNFPPTYNYSNESDRFRYAGPALARSRSREARPGARLADRQGRGLGSDLRHLRGQPRPPPGPEPALVQGLPPPGPGGLFPSQPARTTARTMRLVDRRTRFSGRRTTRSG